MSTSTTVIPISLGFVQAFLLRGPDRAVLIDTGTPKSEKKILRAFSAIHLAPEKISLIIVTHGHTDHFGSAAEMKGHTGAPIAMHPADAPALRRGKNPPLSGQGFALTLLRLFTGLQPGATPMTADRLIQEEFDLTTFGVMGKVIPTPGHTPGSLTVILPSGEMVVGDLIMGKWSARNQPTLPMIVDDSAQLRASINALLALNPTRIYTAHGGPFTPDQIRALL